MKKFKGNLLFCILIILPFILSFSINFHVNNKIKSPQLFSESFKYNVVARLGNVDNIINIKDKVMVEKDKAPSRKKENNRLFKSAINNLSAILVSNTNINFVVIVLFIGLALGTKNIFEKHRRELLKPPDIVFYKNWILKFITPMEKCLQTRADEYDINPLSVVLWGKARTSDICNIPSAGFFYA
jgi:hypothetical protein